MLPIPMFLLLVFSVAILAPVPAILVHLMKTVSLSASPPHPALLGPSTSLLPAKETLYFPVPDPQPTLDVASVCRGQSLVGMAPNSTTRLLQAHETSGYTTNGAAILPVIVLAMVNCLVYRLLVDDTRSEEELEQPMPYQPARLAPSEESTRYYTIYECPSPRPVIHTNIITTASLEHDGLSDAVTAPSCLELGRGPHSNVLFEQSSQFPGVVSYEVLTEDSEKETDHDSSLATLSVSGCCTSCDDWKQGPTAQSTDSRGSSPETLVATIKYSELVPPQCDPLDIEAVKTGVDLSSVPLPQEPESCQSEPQDDPTPLSASEGACGVNNVHESFQSDDPEGDDDGETFDYKGVDWEPSVPTPSPTAEICVTSSPYSSQEPHLRTPSKAEHESTSLSVSKSTLREVALQSSAMYASDDIQVGVKCKDDAKIAYNTRRRIKCASADDLRSMVDLVQVTPFTVPDSGPVNSLRNIADKCISINQVAPLRADLPVFTPSTSSMSEEVVSFAGPPQPPVFVGLKASIHAPCNDDLSQTQTQECVGTLDSMHATKQASPLPIDSPTNSHSPELVAAADEFQGSTHSAPKPCSQDPAAAESSTSQANELEPSTPAPEEEAIQTHKEPAELPVPPTTQVIVGSDSPRGLAASIHAPQGCQAVHSADAPNWAAAARADSTVAASRDSSSAQQRKTASQGLGDDGDESDVPTATRCAAVQDENEVDDSDGSIHDRDGAPAGSYETDSGLDAADDSNEQESTTRSRRSRRRGKPRRPRTKVPYLPPPRMRNLTQHPIVDMIVQARALHGLASNGQHYSLPQQSQHPASVSDQLGQPHISSLQSHTSPAPYYPVLYPENSHGERATPPMPCPVPYGR